MSPRDRILARRAKFIAAALAASGAVACGNVEESPPTTDAAADLGVDAAACLSAPVDGSVWDTGPAPCLSDTGPTPCLEPALDSGPDGSDDAFDAAGDDAFDAEPAPCLKVAPDSGTD